MLEQGATTIWESWSGQSRIHDTLLSIWAWFIQGTGGIRLDENAPGYQHFFVKPAVVGDVTHARASYNPIRGRITSSWRKEEGAASGGHGSSRSNGDGLHPGRAG